MPENYLEGLSSEYSFDRGVWKAMEWEYYSTEYVFGLLLGREFENGEVEAGSVFIGF